MMRRLRQWIADAALSARRAWQTTSLTLVVVTAAGFVVALTLAYGAGLRHTVDRLAASAMASVFVADEADDAAVQELQRRLSAESAVASVRFVSRDENRARFATAFPDLASGVRDDPAALPRSFDVSLHGDAERVGGVVASIKQWPFVVDIRYDQEWIGRLTRTASALTRATLALSAVLVLAAFAMLYAVVRLAYVARRDEIDILYLVGAPLASIRGPFILEAMACAGIGACLGALAARWLLPVAAPWTRAVTTGLPVDVVPMLSAWTIAGMTLAACAAGALAARVALREAER